MDGIIGVNASGVNLKKLFLISAALLAVMSSAQSADLPRAYTKAPMAPVSNWTGFYAGVNVGYGFNDPTASYSANDAYTAFNLPTGIPSGSYGMSGVVGGGQIGYNWQTNPNWVLGLEADIQGANLKGATTSSIPDFLQPSTVTSSQSVEWFGTLRGRAGWLANDRLLIFGTGGLAYGEVKDTTRFSLVSGSSASIGSAGGPTTYINCPFNNGGICYDGSSSKIQVGYALGGGLEYAAWQNMTLKVEYLYANLGSGNLTSQTTINPGAAGTLRSSINTHFSDLDFSVARAGVNYHF